MLAAISYDPVVDIELGPLTLSPHGIGIAVGFLVGARLMLPEAARKGIAEEDVYPLLVRAAIGSVIGARLAYVANHWSEYESLLEVLKVWQGGISLLGGIFGAILLAMPEMRRRRISFWKQMDAAAPGLALGIVIGRIGDLVVGDHLGKVTDFFLGYRCPPPDVETASPCDPGTIVHQTALYDLLLTAVLLAVLLLVRRKSRYDGFLITLFAAWYAGQRIFEDFLRDDVRRFGLTGSQITAIVTLAVCGAWLLLGRRTPRWGRWDETESEPVAVTEVTVGPSPSGGQEPGGPAPGPPQAPPPTGPAGEPPGGPPTMAAPPEQLREE
jgi:phosphatidylglycerol:prolipoprotein diacylglycerol transferase